MDDGALTVEGVEIGSECLDGAWVGHESLSTDKELGLASSARKVLSPARRDLAGEGTAVECRGRSTHAVLRAASTDVRRDSGDDGREGLRSQWCEPRESGTILYISNRMDALPHEPPNDPGFQ